MVPPIQNFKADITNYLTIMVEAEEGVQTSESSFQESVLGATGTYNMYWQYISHHALSIHYHIPLIEV